MSEDLTQNLPNTFEQRVLAEFAALNARLTSFEGHMTSIETSVASVDARLVSVENRLTSVDSRLVSLEDRVLSIDTRLTSLEEKVDARLRETRPIWEGVLERLTEIEKGLGTLNRQFKTMIRGEFDLRTRVEKLEDDQQTV
jgi:predicted nuclease with TOPRIM domain